MTAVLKSIEESGATVASRIKACRATRNGVPAVLRLEDEVRLEDVEAVLGPPRKRTEGTQEIAGVDYDVTWYTYGGIDLAVTQARLDMGTLKPDTKRKAIIAIRIRALEADSS